MGVGHWWRDGAACDRRVEGYEWFMTPSRVRISARI